MTPLQLNCYLCEAALFLVTGAKVKKVKGSTRQETRVAEFDIRLSRPKDDSAPAILEICAKSDHSLLAKFRCTQEGQGTLIPIESETVEDWSLRLMEHAATIIAERTAEQKLERLN